MASHHKATDFRPWLRTALALLVAFAVLAAGSAPASFTQSASAQTGTRNVVARMGRFAPISPSNVAATSSGTVIAVSWKDNSSNDTNYQIQRCRRTPSSCSYRTAATLGANATYFKDAGLTAGTYGYRVRACNGRVLCSSYVASGDVTVGAAPSGGGSVVPPSPTVKTTPPPTPSPQPTLTTTPAPTAAPVPPSTVAPGLTPAPPSTSAPSGTSPFVTAWGTALYLGGQRFRFVGVNRYDLLTINPPGGPYRGCGDSWTDDQLAQWFSEVKDQGSTAVRFWVFQRFTTSGADLAQMDKLLALAGQYGIKLVPVLENQWSSCTAGGYKYDSWYQSGYLSPYDGYPLSYKDYVGRIVSRYKDDPRILMWQLMNEAEGKDTSGNSDAQALYGLALDMSGFVKSIHPNHLVSLGTMGGGQPGTQGNDYRWIHSISTIDVLEFHDYNEETVSFPGDLAQRVQDSISLSKPLFVGESGILSDCTGPRCYSPDQRATLFDAKIGAAFANDVSGYMIWSYRDAASPPIEYMFTATDPLAAVMQKFAASIG